MISRRRVLETMAAALAAARPWAAADSRPRAEVRQTPAAQPAAATGPGVALYPQLFSPLKFRNLTVKNRVFRSNVAGRFDNFDGSGNQARINWEVKFARGGVGAVISSFVPVAMRGRIMPNYATIDRDACIPFWKKLVEQVHGESDCKYILQLSHGGRQRDVPGIEYAKGLSSTDNKDPLHGFECERATVEQIQDIVKAFGQGARRAREAGADGVELHGANGYLITQFLSSAINDRKDEYGGELKNRARFVIEIVRAIRAEVGRDFHLQMKISAIEYNDALLDRRAEGKHARGLDRSLQDARGRGRRRHSRLERQLLSPSAQSGGRSSDRGAAEDLRHADFERSADQGATTCSSTAASPASTSRAAGRKPGAISGISKG